MAIWTEKVSNNALADPPVRICFRPSTPGVCGVRIEVGTPRSLSSDWCDVTAEPDPRARTRLRPAHRPQLPSVPAAARGMASVGADAAASSGGSAPTTIGAQTTDLHMGGSDRVAFGPPPTGAKPAISCATAIAIASGHDQYPDQFAAGLEIVRYGDSPTSMRGVTTETAHTGRRPMTTSSPSTSDSSTSLSPTSVVGQRRANREPVATSCLRRRRQHHHQRDLGRAHLHVRRRDQLSESWDSGRTIAATCSRLLCPSRRVGAACQHDSVTYEAGRSWRRMVRSPARASSDRTLRCPRRAIRNGRRAAWPRVRPP